MTKQKIHIEKELKSSSKPIIWNLISTPEGLSKWVADSVERVGEELQFTWGDPEGRHEIRLASAIERVKHSHFRFRWTDEDDPEAYVELRMEWSDVTGDFILGIIDFAEADEADTLRDLWEGDLERLHRSTGL